jgi:hypothetical protein
LISDRPSINEDIFLYVKSALPLCISDSYFEMLTSGVCFCFDTSSIDSDSSVHPPKMLLTIRRISFRHTRSS